MSRSFTHRQKPCLVVGNFTYFINNRHNNKTYWICSKNRSIRCHARLVTVLTDGQDTIIKRKEIHNHEPDAKPENSNVKKQEIENF